MKHRVQGKYLSLNTFHKSSNARKRTKSLEVLEG